MIGENSIRKTGGFSRRAALRTLFAGSALLGAGSPASAQSGSGAPPVIPWQFLLGQLAVTSGKYKGAFRSTPNGPINWYFANLGLFFLINDMPEDVRQYLNTFIASLDPVSNIISDVDSDLATLVAPDSNDAYAGSFLRLAVKYVRETGDSSWWSANLPRLKALAYSNLLTQIKSNGLVRAFQAPNPNGIGYLMDQCEAYAGLRDFGEYLIETNDPDATYFSAFAMNMGIAIHTLFDSNANQWLWCDVSCPPSNAWYPNLTAQIYPHLYDVHSADAPGDYYRLHRGYEVLNQGSPDWISRPQDIYPWLVVGYYAASRQGQTTQAMAMLSMVLDYYLPGSVNTGRMLISEIGYLKGIIDEASRNPPAHNCAT